MAIKINFDTANKPEKPTFVLATRSGKKIGSIPAEGIVLGDKMNDASEISFTVKKYYDNKKYEYWDNVVNFKLCWCKEWDVWFEITVELDIETETEKTVYCTRLGKAELSQIKLFDIEINSEDDIARDDYVPTVIFDESNPNGSLLHRLLEKAPHYSVIHVDSTIAKLQRTFSFNGNSIDDAFNEIGEEVGCIFVYNSNSDENGNILRTISVYDIQSYCFDCGHRGEFSDVCPECGSTDISDGYGKDTTIFITSDELANEIQFSTDTGSVKNCFKLEAGDDLMTSTIRMCNPNGTDYIWYITDDVKEDMSYELVDKLEKYDEDYQYYYNDYVAEVNQTILTKYNNLVKKYQSFNPELLEIQSPIKGHPALMSAYYNTIDLELYLTSGLMPNVDMSDTSAILELKNLTSSKLSPVAVEKIDVLSGASANSAVLAMAKILVDSRYQVKVKESTYSDRVWTGSFTLTNYSDAEDTADSNKITVVINDNYEQFTKQKIEKALNKNNKGDTSIGGLFEMSYADFVKEIKKYCLNRLISFHDACQSCIDILIEQGLSDKISWADSNPNLYEEIYVPYLNKLKALATEMKLREDEIAIVSGTYNSDGTLKTSGLQTVINNISNRIQTKLDFQEYIGEELWNEFCSYRREDKYSNDNYISDGLNNKEIFDKALEFIEVAKKEIYKSAELQHSISTSLKNLLIMEKFKPIVDFFEVGNWVRIQVDEEVYKLRLIAYEIDYDNLDDISVEFSDVMKTADGLSDQQSIIAQASSMASSYSSVQHQANQGAESKKLLDGWTKEGLDATNTKIMGGADNQVQTWDSHGMLFRKYNAITDGYEDVQMKIINSTIAITDDNWDSTRTAIGKFIYRDPRTGELREGYGVNGEVIVGKMLIGEGLGIYNEGASLSFDENGLVVSNDVNTIIINPNSTHLFSISNEESEILYVNEEGTLVATGTIYAKAGSFGAKNPFFIGDNGFDGFLSIETDSESTISESMQIDLKDGDSYKNNFNLSIIRGGAEDSLNDINLFINSVRLTLSYTYNITREVTTTTTENTSSTTAGGTGEEDDDTINIGGSSSTTTTYETITYNDTINIMLVDSKTNVSSMVAASFDEETGIKTYNYNYSISASDTLTYFRNAIKNNNGVPDSVTASSINVTSAVVYADYSYYFSSYNLYSHIGTDYLNYSDCLVIQDNKVTLGQTIIDDDLSLKKNMYLGMNTFIRGSMASNDYWRILGGGSNDSGYLEIATADNGNEPIYVRQYSGVFANITRTLTLLDGNGNTTIPNILNVRYLKSTSTYLDIQSKPVVTASTFYMGYNTQTTERQIVFRGDSGTYPHFTYMYGGNTSSTTALGFWDGKNGRPILVYNDNSNIVSIGSQTFYFKDYSGTNRMPVASISKDGKRIAVMGSKSSGIYVYGQWGTAGAAFSSRTISTSSSDIRLKENVEDCEIESALDIIDKIMVRSFDWKHTRERQKIGFIADELEKIDSKLALGGGYNSDGTMNTKCVDDFYLMGYIVKAMQELSELYKELSKKVSSNDE